MSRYWLKLVQLGLCFKVRSLRVFLFIEKTKINLRTVRLYLRNKLLVLGVPAGSKPCLFRNRILTILHPVCWAKVADPVIGRVSVYMVNFLYRPHPMDIKPGKSVSVVSFAKDTNFDIPKVADISSHGSGLYARPIPTPNEYSSFGIVGHVLTKLKYAKIVFSHDDSLIVRLVRASSVLAHIRGLFILGAHQQAVHQYRLAQTALAKPAP